MSFSVFATKTVGFDSQVESIKLIKNGIEFELNAEEFKELQDVLAGKRFSFTHFDHRGDYTPHKVTLCSSKDGKQYNAVTYDNN